MMKKKCFVTVGTTQFDALIKTVISSPILDRLRQLGFDKLVIQYGNGSTVPRDSTIDGLTVESFQYRSSIRECMAEADLVIGHAGAGTCLEALELGRAMIVVVNENLMDNHQTELAERLAQLGHLLHCTPSTLAETLDSDRLFQPVPFSAPKPQLFARFIDHFLGISD